MRRRDGGDDGEFLGKCQRTSVVCKISRATRPRARQNCVRQFILSRAKVTKDFIDAGLPFPLCIMFVSLIDRTVGSNHQSILHPQVVQSSGLLEITSYYRSGGRVMLVADLGLSAFHLLIPKQTSAGDCRRAQGTSRSARPSWEQEAESGAAKAGLCRNKCLI